MFLAHISEDKMREHTIKEHLEGTADLAGEFAEAFGCREWGYGCGLLHDIGKYSQAFQNRLRGSAKMTDHSSAGAQELFKRRNLLGAYCISGHHSGLLDGGIEGDPGGEGTLSGRMSKTVEDYHIFEKEVGIPVFPTPPLRSLGGGGFSLSFFVRMLFSCLVDGDFLNTEGFMLGQEAPRGQHDSIEELLKRLTSYVSPWLENRDESTVNGRRTAILNACFEMGKEEPGLFRLTVPTGGGKSISSMAFALEHAKRNQLDRIIYVIPYTSIIEQNAQIFREILGKENVLEAHCNVEYESEEELKLGQLAAENWDCPVVVTTNVQFFESLFSNRSSKCRKLHNIANSVIIFDEAQMLPVPYLKPCIQAISELVYNYKSTAVICTATQPDLQQLFPEEIKIREICPDVRGQYEFFKRVTIEQGGEYTEDRLVQTLESEDQVLCILNNRKGVQKIYEGLKGPGTYHLSTLMYPEHRKRVLAEIRERLKRGEPCRVISTSLVEAGVDFDFPTVYRELAGIDSVIQAAGRCNREGRRNREECKTVVFTLERGEERKVPLELKLPMKIAEQIGEKYEDISSLEAIAEYFKRLYRFKGEALDQKGIVEAFERGGRNHLFPFASVAEKFHLIENETKTILIDREPEAMNLIRRLRLGEHSRKLVREVGRYGVSIFSQDFEHLMGAGMLEELRMNLYLLRNREQYREDMGLTLNVSRGEAVMF